MESEWSVAAAEDDPVVVVPWSDDAGVCCYVDLRTSPASVEEIAEAVAWPELRSALLLLNASGSGAWTAKCDAWELSGEEKSLDFGPVTHGIGCYIDVFRRTVEIFASLDAQLAAIQRMSLAASRLQPEQARADFVLRPAQDGTALGFATTLYVYGYGDDIDAARAQWATALANVTQVILADALE